MAKRAKFTFESNVDKIIEQINATPEKVLNVVGRNLVKEIRGTMRNYSGKLTGRLDKSLGYWARKREKDLQIGFKIFYSPFVLKNDDPLRPAIMKNAELIQQMFNQALQEMGKR